ncbi:hypothetical protein Dsin_013936 [Dipteronia sinensis]|uniref:ABC-2 type transporter transmembrane domain-containing protein n=1 Tax=Dipteronia sinensis TaxID=43782 RepID=A0AAE0E9G4_9ROSI|nr:hypothetical protein Dsin_013936 [Dipteronia sinensis]
MIIGAMCVSVIFVGINNCSTVPPVVAVERTIFYHERAAGMYSALPYVLAQRIPKWWTWYHYICPVARRVYGLIVAQYGDIGDTIKVLGIFPDPSIKWHVQNHFSSELNFIGQTAAILVAFAAFFALMFAVYQDIEEDINEQDMNHEL